MPYDPDEHHRRSIRLRGWDYTSAGAYFITICTHRHACLLGEVVEYEMVLNPVGHMVRATWERLPERFPSVQLDAFVVMPNHLHGVLVLVEWPMPGERDAGAPLAGEPKRAGTRPAPTTIGSVVGAFKSVTTAATVHGVDEQGWPPFRSRFWQRNYYETIIRNERHLDAVRKYIANNPANWTEDRYHPDKLDIPE